MTLPFFSLLYPSHQPSGTVSLFFISVSLVIFCYMSSFVDEIPLVGEIILYLSFIAWLISLSIMLFSTFYAVVKGILLGPFSTTL